MMRKVLSFVVVLVLSVVLCCCADATTTTDEGYTQITAEAYEETYKNLNKKMYADNSNLYELKFACAEAVFEEMEVPVEESFICITGLYLDYFFKNAEGDYYTFKLSSHDERRSMLQYLDTEEAWDPVCWYEDGIVWVSFIVE